MQNSDQSSPVSEMAISKAYCKSFKIAARSMVGKAISSVQAHESFGQREDISREDISIVTICFTDGTVATFEANHCDCATDSGKSRPSRIHLKA